MADPATELVSGARRIGGAALDERVRRAAAGLAALGVARGDCVAILMRNDIPFIETAYAAQALGAYSVPVNWHFKAEEIAYILGDCGARVLVGHADLIAPVAAALPKGVAVIAVATPPEVASAYGIAPVPPSAVPGARDYEAWLAAHAPHRGEMPSPAAHHVLHLGHDRPSQGRAPPAPTPAQMGASERLRRDVFGITPGIRCAVPGPLYHSAPNAFAMRAGRVARTMVLMPRFDPVGLLAAHRARAPRHHVHGADHVHPPAQAARGRAPALRHLLAQVRHPRRRALPARRQARDDRVVGARSSTSSTAPPNRARSRSPPAPTPWPSPAPSAAPCKAPSYASWTRTATILPAGEVGEIFTRFAELPDFTYHNRPDERARIDREGFITSGDVGYLDADGYLFLCDRKRDMVISGGVNIYPAEIEAVLHALAGVKDCAVFGIPDAEFGERLMAVVEPADGAALTAADVQAHLRAHLADYKVPKSIEIARDLPREDSGKIFKRRLRDPYWQDAGRRI